jgi:hypothetical protein
MTKDVVEYDGRKLAPLTPQSPLPPPKTVSQVAKNILTWARRNVYLLPTSKGLYMSIFANSMGMKVTKNPVRRGLH